MAESRREPSASKLLARLREGGWGEAFAGLPVFFLVIDRDDRILEINRTQHGVAREAFLGESVYRFVDPAYHETTRRALAKVFASGEAVSFPSLVGDDPANRTHLENYLGPVVHEGEVVAACIVALETAVREEAEVWRRAAEDRLRRLATSMAQGLLLVNRDEVISSANPAAHEIFGVAEGGLVGRGVLEWVPEEEQERLHEESRLRRAGRTSSFEHRIRRSNGELRQLLVHATPVFDFDGEVVGTEALFSDITEQRRAEEALRESEERFRTIVAQAPAVTFVIDADGTFVLSEGRALRTLGLTPGEAVGRSVYDMYAAVPEILEAVEEALSGRTHRHVVAVGESVFDTFYTPRLDREGKVTGVFGMAFDVTESHRLERQLRQAQKMEAIGTLAGGIAHDFNNILLAMLGTAELAREELAEDDPVRGDLDDILAFGSRATELVRQLLTYARPARGDREPIPVADSVDEVLRIAQVNLPPSIRIERRIDRPGATVRAAPTELHQILLNLMTNAGQAMEKQGGVLEIRVGETESPPPDPGDEAAPSGVERWVLMSICDTGPGMSPEIIERIFDPFFTTRAIDRGSGMGLSVVHGLVQSLRGRIEVRSTPGEGSTFTVYLPAVAAGAAASKRATVDPDRARRDPASPPSRLLVVDDDPTVLTLLKRLVEGLGYRVSAYERSPEALAAFTAEPGSFDAVITDQRMPDLSGLELTGHLLALRPDLPVIMVTGFGGSATEATAKEAGIRAFLTKPILSAELDRTLAEVLADR